MSDNYTPELPRLVLYVGDKITPALVAELVTAFTAVSGKLVGPDDADDTALYCANNPTASGNQLTAATIGTGSGTIVPGDYKYYITGTYDGGSITTWYWPVSAIAKLGGT